MYKKNIIPLQFFLILEKINISFFFSRNNKFKNFFFLINLKFFFFLIKSLKYEILTNNSFLLENSGIDLKNFMKSNVFNKKKILIFNNFFNYYSNINFIFLTFLNNVEIKNNSLESIFKNANWLERETSEMYGLYFFNKKDSRKLLLDYSKKENPLLKEFPCEGTSEIFYNFFDFQINFFNNQIVEL